MRAIAVLRLVALTTSLLCIILSAAPASEAIGLGFAIGGWTGLPGYEAALQDAHVKASAAWSRFFGLQLLGGVAAFVVIIGRVKLWWSLILITCFPILSILVLRIASWVCLGA